MISVTIGTYLFAREELRLGELPSFWIGIDFSDDFEQVPSVCLVHNPKDALPAGVCLQCVIAVSGMEKDHSSLITVEQFYDRVIER